jgi:hypothetical protein
MFANLQSPALRGRGPPPRVRDGQNQQFTNYKQGHRRRESPPRPPSLSDRYPSNDFDSTPDISAATNNLTSGVTAQETSESCFSPNYRIVPNPAQHARFSQTSISPLEPPSSEYGMGGYPLGDYNSAVNASSFESGVINSGTGRPPSFASQSLSRPPSQQLPREQFNTAFYQSPVVPSNNTGYTGCSGDSRYDLSNPGPQHAEHSVSRRMSRNQSTDSQMGQEGYEVTNRTMFQISHSQPGSKLSRVRSAPIRTRTTTNHPTPYRHSSVDKHPLMQLDLDLQKRMSALRVSEDEDNANYITGNNQMWNDGSSVESRSTAHSGSRNSVESAYSSPASDDDGSSSWQSYPQPANSPNGSVFSSVDLQRAYKGYKEQNRSDDVGFGFSPILPTVLTGELGESFLMRGRCLARSPTEVV